MGRILALVRGTRLDSFRRLSIGQWVFVEGIIITNRIFRIEHALRFTKHLAQVAKAPACSTLPTKHHTLQSPVARPEGIGEQAISP